MITKEMCDEKIEEMLKSFRPVSSGRFHLYKRINLIHNHGYIFASVNETSDPNYIDKPFTPMPAEFNRDHCYRSVLVWEWGRKWEVVPDYILEDMGLPYFGVSSILGLFFTQ